MEEQLFETEEPAPGRGTGDLSGQPLAARMRPGSLGEFVGQEHLLGRGSALRTAIEDGRPHSMVLYGPPGTGKTTLARLLAVNARAAFEEESAVAAGRAEVRAVLERAEHRRRTANEGTIFFLDEIHRFNKAQQDTLLPAVEEGLVVLVGATTENPYFEVNSALLSRCRIYELRPLGDEHVLALLQRALGAERGIPDAPRVDDDALEFLAARSAGDARTALSALELAAETVGEGGAVTMRVAEDALQRSAILYDKGGDLHYDLISAWIKSTRGSDPDASLLYLAAMLEGGEDPRFIARRMVVLASEDIGNADPRALEVAVSAAHAVEHVGLPECALNLAQAAVYLALAPKSNASYEGIARPRLTESRPMEAALRPAEATELESFSPFDGKRLGAVPTVTPAEVQSVVDDVASVQPFWAQLPLVDRARYMRRAAQAIIDQIDELAELLSREQGKVLNESYVMELLPTIDSLRWLADAGPEILDDERIPLPIFLKQKRARFTYEPLGVVGVIAPWNYPWSIPFGEVAIALMAGNGVVLKPASLTPLIGQRIQDVFERAGLPEGLVRTVHGGGAVGQALVESSAKKIFFTGSVEVGRQVGVACAERMKGSVLELGGKDPMLVLADANLPNAISGCLWGGFANAGQTCSGIERVYVMREVAERFVEGVVAGARALRVGDPMDGRTEIGPMVSGEQLELVKELVDDAVANGATLHCGGAEEPFFRPAVLTGVTRDMRLMREEIFGPVVPIVTARDEDEAIALANDSEFGLGASVWSMNRAKGERMARRLEAGMVWVNDHMFSHGACSCSWGGVKSSGLGRSHSKFGLYECVNIKLLTWEPSRTRDFWWHPYDEALGKAMQASARLLYGRDADKPGALRRGALPLARVGRKTLRDVFKR